MEGNVLRQQIKRSFFYAVIIVGALGMIIPFYG